MITYKDIERSTMTEAKRREAKNDLFAFYVGRPISYLCTIPLLYTKISPNTISFISLLFVVAGCLVYTFAYSKTAALIGLLMFFCWNIFDGIDGNIARYKKQFSPNGELWDATAGYCATAGTFMCMGIYASRASQMLIQVDPDMLIILGAWSSIATILPRLVMHKKRGDHPENKEVVSNLNDKGTYSAIKSIVLNFISTAGLIQVIWLLAILFGFMNIIVIGYAIVNIIIMVYSLITLLRN